MGAVLVRMQKPLVNSRGRADEPSVVGRVAFDVGDAAAGDGRPKTANVHWRSPAVHQLVWFGRASIDGVIRRRESTS